MKPVQLGREYILVPAVAIQSKQRIFGYFRRPNIKITALSIGGHGRDDASGSAFPLPESEMLLLWFSYEEALPETRPQEPRCRVEKACSSL